MCNLCTDINQALHADSGRLLGSDAARIMQARLHTALRNRTPRRGPITDGPRILRRAEFNSIVTQAANDPRLDDLHDAIRLVWNTGLRAGEIGSLRWSQVDHASRTIHVGTRKVPFGRATLRILEERRLDNPTAEFVFGANPIRTRDRFAVQFARVAAAVGLPGVSFHAIRSSWAARFIENGGSPDALRLLGGWRAAFPLKSVARPNAVFDTAKQVQAEMEEQS